MPISQFSTPFDHFQILPTLAVNPNLILEPCLKLAHQLTDFGLVHFSLLYFLIFIWQRLYLCLYRIEVAAVELQEDER